MRSQSVLTLEIPARKPGPRHRFEPRTERGERMGKMNTLLPSVMFLRA